MTEKELRAKLRAVKESYELSFREIEAEVGLSHAFIYQFMNGSGIGHDKALKLQDFLTRFKERREFWIRLETPDFGMAICGSPPLGLQGEFIHVREVINA